MKKKILYFECKTGAAGDMLMGALYSLLPPEDQKKFLEILNTLGEDIRVEPVKTRRQSISGIHMKVTVKGKEEDLSLTGTQNETPADLSACTRIGKPADSAASVHRHSHTGYEKILNQINSQNLAENVKRDAVEIYRLIGEAEARVHNTDIKEIHFHEVGSRDAFADVVGCSLAVEMLQPDEILCSPVCVGNGTVRCAHGILPVPAPATAEIIKGMPVYTSSFDGELLTPTGAAVLKHFAQAYKKQVEMEISDIGYGFGTRTFEQLSCVRAFLGYR